VPEPSHWGPGTQLRVARPVCLQDWPLGQSLELWHIWHTAAGRNAERGSLATLNRPVGDGRVAGARATSWRQRCGTTSIFIIYPSITGSGRRKLERKLSRKRGSSPPPPSIPESRHARRQQRRATRAERLIARGAAGRIVGLRATAQVKRGPSEGCPLVVSVAWPGGTARRELIWPPRVRAAAVRAPLGLCRRTPGRVAYSAAASS
jgi:hypothetical protein